MGLKAVLILLVSAIREMSWRDCVVWCFLGWSTIFGWSCDNLTTNTSLLSDIECAGIANSSTCWENCSFQIIGVVLMNESQGGIIKLKLLKAKKVALLAPHITAKVAVAKEVKLKTANAIAQSIAAVSSPRPVGGRNSDWSLASGTLVFRSRPRNWPFSVPSLLHSELSQRPSLLRLALSRQPRPSRWPRSPMLLPSWASWSTRRSSSRCRLPSLTPPTVSRIQANSHSCPTNSQSSNRKSCPVWSAPPSMVWSTSPRRAWTSSHRCYRTSKAVPLSCSAPQSLLHSPTYNPSSSECLCHFPVDPLDLHIDPTE